MASAAREIATHVLYRVLHDSAWAAPTLDAELKRREVGRSDAALATQIVYGALRTAPRLQERLERHSSGPIKVDDWSRAALLAGAFQLLHLARVPPHAIVHETVEIVRKKRGPRVAGFANALLRRLATERPKEPALPESLSVTPWLQDALVQSLGEERAGRLLAVPQERPSFDLRVREGIDREVVAEAIAAAHPEAVVELTALSPVGVRVAGAGDPRALPGFAQGDFAVQEEGAQLIGSMLGAVPGERVLDACAGRGGKTAQLVEAVGAEGHVVASDLHEHRLEQIESTLAQLRLDPARLTATAVDWTVGAGAVQGPMDRVLIDAPCTGLGTLRRRPEIVLRSKAADVGRMAEVQARILTHASKLVAPGGTLLYAVCSPLRAEGAEVVRRVSLAGLRPVTEAPPGLPPLELDPDGRLLLGPWLPGAGPWADAYQVYVWVNVG